MRKIIIIALLVLSCASLTAQDEGCVERLKKHVSFFASDSLLGRKAGSHGEKLASEYIYDRMYDAGVIMLSPREGQDFSMLMEDDTLFSRNIVGIVEGYDPKLKNEYLLIGAHMDHLGTNILTVNGKEVLQIFPGADNNGSGLAILVELAERISASSFSFKRSVIFAAFGAGELGMAGSWYFANKAFSEMDSLSLMIDLNMLGQMGTTGNFTYYTCVPNPEITYTIGNVSNSLSMRPPKDGRGEMMSSDYLAFYEKEIPVALFTTGKHRDTRTVRDRAEMLDYGSMEMICEFVYHFAREVANKDNMINRGGFSEKETAGEDRIYSPYEVDRAPRFFHGDEKVFLQRWVYEYLKYPDIPMAMGISGQVIVEFVIEKDGSVTNVAVAKSVDPDLDDEAVRVISVSPKWKAGTLGGQKVRVKYSVPVEFKLKKK